jgi:hypothetical protein
MPRKGNSVSVLWLNSGAERIGDQLVVVWQFWQSASIGPWGFWREPRGACWASKRVAPGANSTSRIAILQMKPGAASTHRTALLRESSVPSKVRYSVDLQNAHSSAE